MNVKKAALRTLKVIGVIAASILVVLALISAMVFGSDDSDNARMQAMEDSIEEDYMAQEAARHARSLRMAAETSDPSDLTEEERSAKYQEAKNIEDNWMSYANQEVARRLNPDPKAGYPYRPEKDMNDALDLYIEVAHTEVVAIDDVVRASRYILEGDPIQKANKEFAEGLRKEKEIKVIWSNSDRDRAISTLLDFYTKVKNEKVKTVLVDAAVAYKSELLAIGFNPALRYRSGIDLKNAGWEDPRYQVTHCGMHEKHVNMLASLTAAVKAGDEKKWALHATDLLISDFCCDCTGEYRPETESNGAYERYIELGDVATAKIVALDLAQANAYIYANGWEPIESANPHNPDESPESIPVLMPEYRSQAEAWYSRAGWDKGTVEIVILDRLKKAAKDKADEERYEEARDLYRKVGDEKEARRMQLLVGPEEGDA